MFVHTLQIAALMLIIDRKFDQFELVIILPELCEFSIQILAHG